MRDAPRSAPDTREDSPAGPTVDPEILMDVVFDNIFDDVDSFSCCKFDSDQIQYDFYEIENEAADLDGLDEGVLTTEEILEDKGD